MRKLIATATLLLSAGLFADVPTDAVWIDVRTPSEFDAGHVEGAVRISWDGIKKGVAQMGLERDRPIYLYCGAGGRAEKAREQLAAEGYSAVINAGGLEDARTLAGQTD